MDSVDRTLQKTQSHASNSRCSSIILSNQASISESSMQYISDVVGFSLCSLSSIRLNYLYPEEFHDSFRKSTIRHMIEHFGLPAKVENSLNEFVTDDEFTFLSSIKNNYDGKVFKLIEELVLLSISSGSYDARLHYLIVDIAELMGIPRDLVELHCESVYGLLLKAQYPLSATKPGDKNKEQASNSEEDAESKRYLKQRDSRNKIKKYLMIGLASLGGGAVIGVTGGLAAPIVASAFGAAIGASGFVMSSAAAGVVGSLFGVAGAGLTASKMQKRIGELEEFSFESLNKEHDQTSLTITIAISGLINDKSDEQFLKPWKCLRHTKEQYCLRYESKYLLELSQAMDYLLSFVVSYAAQEALKYTFLAGVMAAIAWPTALISMANIIDNPWDVCIRRSAEAGKHLADILLERRHGKRPVSLIGFSLGARVIYFCLQELSNRANSEGIIGDVVLLGAPVTACQDQWRPLGRIISGQIINGYSSSDWLLKFLYRTSSAAIRVAGLQPLCWNDRRVRNVDLTPLVGGHMDYYKKLSQILRHVNVRTLTTSAERLDEGRHHLASGAVEEADLLSSSGSFGASSAPSESVGERSDSQSSQLLANKSPIRQQQADGAQQLDAARIASLAPTSLASGNGESRPQQQWPANNNNNNNGRRRARRPTSPVQRLRASSSTVVGRRRARRHWRARSI